MRFLRKEQKLILWRRGFFSFLCECASFSYDATAAKSLLFYMNSIQLREKERFNLSSLVYGLIKKFPIRKFYALKYGKTGNKKRATCFATLLQNELNSDVARYKAHVKPVLQQIRLLTGLNMGGKTRRTLLFNSVCSNVAKHVARFLLSVFPYLESCCNGKEIRPKSVRHHACAVRAE